MHVDGGPTGVVFHGGKGFPVRAGGATDPARFIYACEDGMIRAWTPTVPGPWSTEAEVVVDEAAEAAVFRGIAIAGGRVYATDFHNGRVAVYDSHWRRVRRAGAFTDPAIPDWYAPFGIQAIGGHVFVTYVWRAPVNGNDAPTGGYVDEFDLDGRLVARVAHRGALNAPWGMAVAPVDVRPVRRRTRSSATSATAASTPTGSRAGAGGTSARSQDAARQAARHQRPLGHRLRQRRHERKPDELFFTSGPHEWRGVTELGVHGLLGSISAA